MGTGKRKELLPPLWVVTILILALLGYLTWELKEIVTLLVLGFCIAYVLHPVLSKLEASGIRRTVGVFVVLVLFLSTILLMAVTALPTISREFTSLSQNFPAYVELARTKAVTVIEAGERFLPEEWLDERDPSELLQKLPMPSGAFLKKIVDGAWGALMQGYSITLTLVNLALLPFIVFYLAVDFSKLDDGFLKLFPVLQRSKVEAILAEINSYVAAFVRGQFTVGFILTLLYALGLGLLGVELWFLLAVISGFGNVIPYLGTLIGILLSTLMALVTFGTLWHVCAVLGVYLLVQLLEGNLITPKIIGDKVGFSPLVVIIALVAGGTLFGLAGVILAIPGAAVIKVLSRHAYVWILREANLR